MLARIVRDESGMWAEYLDGGEWVEDSTALDFLTDPSYGEEVSETEAHEIALRLGGA